VNREFNYEFISLINSYDIKIGNKLYAINRSLEDLFTECFTQLDLDDQPIDTYRVKISDLKKDFFSILYSDL
jgi:hypothetical protein